MRPPRGGSRLAITPWIVARAWRQPSTCTHDGAVTLTNDLSEAAHRAGQTWYVPRSLTLVHAGDASRNRYAPYSSIACASRSPAGAAVPLAGVWECPPRARRAEAPNASYAAFDKPESPRTQSETYELRFPPAPGVRTVVPPPGKHVALCEADGRLYDVSRAVVRGKLAPHRRRPKSPSTSHRAAAAPFLYSHARRCQTELCRTRTSR